MSHNRKRIGRSFQSPMQKKTSDFYISLLFFVLACFMGLTIGYIIQAVLS